MKEVEANYIQGCHGNLADITFANVQANRPNFPLAGSIQFDFHSSEMYSWLDAQMIVLAVQENPKRCSWMDSIMHQL